MFNPKLKHKFLDEAEQYGAKRLVDSVKRSRGRAAKPPAIGIASEPGAMPDLPEEHAAEGMPGELAEDPTDGGRLTPDEMAQLRHLLSKMR